MVKAVIFDLDNTLVDFMKMKHAAIDEAMSAMIDAGLKIDKKKGKKILFKLYEKYGIEDKAIFQHFLYETLGRIDYKILSSGIVAYRKIKSGILTTFPGVMSTLIELKSRGVKLAIVSDAPRLRAWIRLSSMKLADFFDVVVTYDDTKKYKPHPAPFLKAMSVLKLEPKDAIMVGDWPERDMKGAKSLGITTCYAKYGAFFKHKNVKADYILDKVTDLLEIAKKDVPIKKVKTKKKKTKNVSRNKRKKN